jgi:hypothetical protein
MPHPADPPQQKLGIYLVAATGEPRYIEPY